MGAPILVECGPPLKRGPRPKPASEKPTGAFRQREYRVRKGETRLRHIAILDFETDPFDQFTKEPIYPFACELYSDQFGPIVIWEENFELFVEKVYTAIVALPDAFTIYAHNGGKFDYMFLVSKLRGDVKFKGRAIMSAKLGNHELRDSLHILPEKLAAWKKDHFDYTKMAKKKRNKHRQEILDYLHSDCVYLFDIVKSFLSTYGFKISIGQAAFSELKKSYKVSHVEPKTDEFMRTYFFGGRVECLAGRGHFKSGTGPDGYKMFDVNSMYPAVMANFLHPTGNEYNWRRGLPGKDTFFVAVECEHTGAFVRRMSDGEISSERGRGKYLTTIHEFNAAVDCKLIKNYKIISSVDCVEATDFSKFILPMYEKRQIVKRQMELFRKSAPETYDDIIEYQECKKTDLFLKYLLNNSYGKFAQNPERFKEFYYTDAGVAPPLEWFEDIPDEHLADSEMPFARTDLFYVWSKPSPGRKYNNVGTAASITGAARSVLMRAIASATDPIYCDTDSIICRDLTGVVIDKTLLGAWDLEEKYDEVIIAGKKLYACKVAGYPDGHSKRIKVRCKGAPGATWDDFINMMQGDIITKTNPAPTITRTGKQFYMSRRIRATAPLKEKAL